MTPALLQELIVRFQAFTDAYRTDGALEPMLQLKLEHTLRVAADARAVAFAEGWPEEEQILAEAIGLFHDVARFPQFRKYRSFSDADTIDHGELGVQTLEKEGLLAGVAQEASTLILRAVSGHNKRNLLPRLTAQEERHLRLIRDADRLDIFFICWDTIQTGHIHDHPEIMMNLDFYGPPSAVVLEQFERGEPIDYRGLQTMADRFVLQLSWMNDLSYAASRRLVLQRGILEKFISVLPVHSAPLLRCFEQTATRLALA
jgi:hypothetical protein